MPQFSDLFGITEDERIALIAETAKSNIVGFIVEDDDKADRYIHKLRVLVPNIKILFRGPLHGAIVVKVTVQQ